MTPNTEALTECRSPKCKEPPREGRRFCGFHADIMDSVKASEKKRADKVTASKNRPNAHSTCCVPGCLEPRVSTERYCPACQAKGWREEEYGL